MSSYFQHLDAWLEEVLQFAEGEDDEQWLARVKKQIKDEVLKSYRNGQQAGPSKESPAGESGKGGDAPRPRRRFSHGR